MSVGLLRRVKAGRRALVRLPMVDSCHLEFFVGDQVGSEMINFEEDEMEEAKEKEERKIEKNKKKLRHM